MVIVDQYGNSLGSEPEGLGRFSEKRTLEQYINHKVLRLLRAIFPHQAITVSSDINLNYDKIQAETQKPESRILVQEKSSRHTRSPHNAKNAPPEEAIQEKSYRYGERKEHLIRAHGTIERITISILLPQNTTPKDIQAISALVKTAIGFKETRGDALSIAPLLPEPIASEKTALVTPVSVKPSTTDLPIPKTLLGVMTGLLLLTAFLITRLLLNKPRTSSLALPDLAFQLAETSPLDIAIILSQGTYPWEKRFLSLFDKTGQIQDCIHNTVPHIKPMVQKLLWESWLLMTQSGKYHGKNI